MNFLLHVDHLPPLIWMNHRWALNGTQRRAFSGTMATSWVCGTNRWRPCRWVEDGEEHRWTSTCTGRIPRVNLFSLIRWRLMVPGPWPTTSLHLRDLWDLECGDLGWNWWMGACLSLRPSSWCSRSPTRTCCHWQHQPRSMQRWPTLPRVRKIEWTRMCIKSGRGMFSWRGRSYIAGQMSCVVASGTLVVCVVLIHWLGGGAPHCLPAAALNGVPCFLIPSQR